MIWTYLKHPPPPPPPPLPAGYKSLSRLELEQKIRHNDLFERLVKAVEEKKEPPPPPPKEEPRKPHF